MALFGRRRARLFGALLDATAEVLAQLPSVRPPRLPRMADFGRVLAAADAAGVTAEALKRFGDQHGRIAAEVIDADPFGAALVSVRCGASGRGPRRTCWRRCCLAAPSKPPHGWPRRNAVKGRLKRLTPALAAQGVAVSWEREGATHERRRLIRLALGK